MSSRHSTLLAAAMTVVWMIGAWMIAASMAGASMMGVSMVGASVVEARAVQAPAVETRVVEAQTVRAPVVKDQIPAEEVAFEHPTLVLQDSTFLLEGDEESRPLAEISLYCLECHATDSATHPDESPSLGPPGHSHPVEVPYPEVAQGYVPMNDLDPHLTLIEGRLTCGTCHDLAQSDHRTALSTEQGRLCMACHLR